MIALLSSSSSRIFRKKGVRSGAGALAVIIALMMIVIHERGLDTDDRWRIHSIYCRGAP
jgi:hypothetical protein